MITSCQTCRHKPVNKQSLAFSFTHLTHFPACRPFEVKGISLNFILPRQWADNQRRQSPGPEKSRYGPLESMKDIRPGGGLFFIDFFCPLLSFLYAAAPAFSTEDHQATSYSGFRQSNRRI